MPFLRDRFSGAEDSTHNAPTYAQVAANTASTATKMSVNFENVRAVVVTAGEVFGTSEPMDGVLPTSSQPPSPPDSRSPTPLVRLMPCPVRLLPLIPALNFGCVAPNKIYRSAFPQARNMEFMEVLRIKSILTLVIKTKSCEVYDMHVYQNGTNRMILDVEPNKEGKISTNFSTLCEAILFALNPNNQPVWIHCNQGRHRTGCVVACIRKIQQWPMDEILEEYKTYAHPKPREGDIELIKNFDPQEVFDFASQHDLLKGFTSKQEGRERADSITSVYELAASLPVHWAVALRETNAEDDEDEDESMEEEDEDEAMEKAMARCIANVKNGNVDNENPNIDPLLTQTVTGSASDVAVSEYDAEEDGLDNSLDAMDGDSEERMTFEGVKIVSPSATTPAIPIRRRS